MPVSTKIDATVARPEGTLAAKRLALTHNFAKTQSVPWRHDTVLDSFTRPIKGHAHNAAVYGGHVGRLAEFAAGQPASATANTHRAIGVVPPVIENSVSATKSVLSGAGAGLGTLIGTGTFLLALPWNGITGEKTTFATWIDNATTRGRTWTDATAGWGVDKLGSVGLWLNQAAALAAHAICIGISGALGAIFVGLPHGICAAIGHLFQGAVPAVKRQAAAAGDEVSRMGERASKKAQEGGHAASHALHDLGERVEDTASDLVTGAKKLLHRTAANTDAAASKVAERTEDAAERVADESHAAAQDADAAATAHAHRAS